MGLMVSTDYLNDLTEAQRSAVTHIDGPMLVLAGPGSGKTRVVTSRVVHLLANAVSPRSILALTFTNKAADEMRRRISQLAPGNPVWVSTFHRFCSQLLRTHCRLVGLDENFRIYDSEDSLKTLKSVVEDQQVPLRRYTPRQLARTISNAKNLLRTPSVLEAKAVGPLEVLAAEVYPEYQKRLLASNAVDFDDLLMHVAVLLRDNAELRTELDERYQYILVDEYQDTNFAQYMIIRSLSIVHPNLSVTGDPDQSIYAWRGADIANILDFEKDYPKVKVVRLEQNYRSTKSILRVADQLIANNVHRKEKSLFTENPQGDKVRLVRYEDGRDEAEDIARQIGDCLSDESFRPRDFAILYRTNALSRNIEHALHDFGIPYQIVNGVEFYQRKEIKDVLGYLHLLNNPKDEIAFLRVVNTPARGIGPKSVQRLREFAYQIRVPLIEACRSAAEIPGLTARARNALLRFVQMFDQLQSVVEEPLEAIVGRVLMESGYRDHLKDSPAEEDQQRLANIEELVTAARQFDDRYEEGGSLEEFLEQASLVADTDAWDTEGDKVTLMTLHAAKGLEFPAVFIVALEQGILPHERSREDEMQMEEERRLLFVGMTRAEQHLQMSLTNSREYRGRYRSSVPSFFLMEFPRHEMDCFGIDVGPGYHGGAASRRLGDEATGEEADELANEWAEQERQASLADPMIEDPAEPAPTGDVAPVITAAHMMNESADESSHDQPVSPEIFELGMLVIHPDYGPGKIISLSGQGNRRMATIQFLQPPLQRKILLAFSALKPAIAQR